MCLFVRVFILFTINLILSVLSSFVFFFNGHLCLIDLYEWPDPLFVREYGPLAFVYASFRQEVLLLGNEIAFNEAVIDEREQGIQEIQQQIGEVNEIFKDLAVLVHEQGVVIGKSLKLIRIYLFIFFHL